MPESSCAGPCSAPSFGVGLATGSCWRASVEPCVDSRNVVSSAGSAITVALSCELAACVAVLRRLGDSLR